jgi:hypothetical protein
VKTAPSIDDQIANFIDKVMPSAKQEFKTALNNERIRYESKLTSKNPSVKKLSSALKKSIESLKQKQSELKKIMDFDNIDVDDRNDIILEKGVMSHPLRYCLFTEEDFENFLKSGILPP